MSKNGGERERFSCLGRKGEENDQKLGFGEIFVDSKGDLPSDPPR